MEPRTYEACNDITISKSFEVIVEYGAAKATVDEMNTFKTIKTTVKSVCIQILYRTNPRLNPQ